jgi:hypothetical protein
MPSPSADALAAFTQSDDPIFAAGFDLLAFRCLSPARPVQQLRRRRIMLAWYEFWVGLIVLFTGSAVAHGLIFHRNSHQLLRGQPAGLRRRHGVPKPSRPPPTAAVGQCQEKDQATLTACTSRPCAVSAQITNKSKAIIKAAHHG